MSMAVFTPLPDPMKIAAELRREIEKLRAQLETAQEELRQERQKTAAMESGVRQLRAVLTPLYQALAHIFGEIDAMGVGAMPPTATGVDPRKAAVWEDWKQKLGGQAAKAIDALLLHGELTQTQLRLHIGCARGSVPGIVYQLNKAALINKNGGRISLKEL